MSDWVPASPFSIVYGELHDLSKRPCVIADFEYSPVLPPHNLYSLSHIADNHIILPFFLSFLPVLLTLFLLHWIEPHFCVSLNRLYSCDSL